MAYGVLGSGWIAADTPVSGAGEFEWERMTGVPATHPLVGGDSWGPDMSGFQPDAGMARIVTTGDSGGSVAPSGAALNQFDDWRNLFNFRHSPSPWVLLALLAAVGLVSARLSVGPYRAAVGR